MEFNSSNEIQNFFERYNATDEEKIEELFYSPSTEDPKIMMLFHNYASLHTTLNIRETVLYNKDRLFSENLSLYKFKILLGMRGSGLIDEVIGFIKEHHSDETVQLLAKHDSCPSTAKTFMFKTYKDPSYLNSDVKEMFIF